MDQRYDEVLGFAYAALAMVSEKNLAIFQEFLKELNTDEGRIRNMRIADDGLQAALRGYSQLKRISESLERIRKKKQSTK